MIVCVKNCSIKNSGILIAPYSLGKDRFYELQRLVYCSSFVINSYLNNIMLANVELEVLGGLTITHTTLYSVKIHY